MCGRMCLWRCGWGDGIRYTWRMPTILRFRGFNIGFFVHDHAPIHVHAQGSGKQLIVLLHCAGGAVEVRNRYGTTPADEAMLTRFIQENRDILCKAWEEIHGSRAED